MPITGKKITQPAKEFEKYYVEAFLVTADNAPEKGGNVSLNVTFRPYNADEKAENTVQVPSINMLESIDPDNFESAEDKALALEGAQAYASVMSWLAKKSKKLGVI